MKRPGPVGAPVVPGPIPIHEGSGDLGLPQGPGGDPVDLPARCDPPLLVHLRLPEFGRTSFLPAPEPGVVRPGIAALALRQRLQLGRTRVVPKGGKGGRGSLSGCGSVCSIRQPAAQAAIAIPPGRTTGGRQGDAGRPLEEVRHKERVNACHAVNDSPERVLAVEAAREGPRAAGRAPSGAPRPGPTGVLAGGA